MTDQVKTCSKCGKEKCISDFHKNKGGLYGRRSICKICLSLDNSNRYQENKDSYRAVRRNWQENNRDKCRAYNKKYRSNNPDKLKEKAERNIHGLSDTYVLAMLSTTRGRRPRWALKENANQELQKLIELKRVQLQITRKLRETN